ncbi:MAG: cytochrome b/b6 domain-containing protein [Hyphomicrobiales bacterium]
MTPKNTGPKPWDLFVRTFHWLLAIAFLTNALFVDEESKLHEYLGYAVLGLLGLRVVWGFVGPKRVRFSAFPLSIKGSMEHLRAMFYREPTDAHASHSPLGAVMVYNLLISLFLLGATGYMMTTTTFWGYEWVEDIHEFLSNWVLFSIVVLVVGIIFESKRTKSNLTKSMIGGNS